MKRIKEGLRLGALGSVDDVLDFEAAVQPELFLSADAREGMKPFSKSAARDSGPDRGCSVATG